MQLFQNDQSQRKVLVQEEKGEKQSANNFTEDVIYKKMFIAKMLKNTITKHVLRIPVPRHTW